MNPLKKRFRCNLFDKIPDKVLFSKRTFTTDSSNINDPERVAARVHALQNVYEQTLPANAAYVLRLDGVAFRNYTVGMDKPFDNRFIRAMLLTSKDILERCSARAAFCQSDEISLLFAPESSTKQIIYAGRIQKIVSVMASLAAARFNWHISKLNWPDDLNTALLKRIRSNVAIFDGRVFSAPDDIMAGEAIYWRHAYDGRRNAVNMAASKFYTHRQLYGLPMSELVEKLRSEKSVDPFKNYPPSAMFGVLLKKRHFPHVGINPKTGQAVPTIRARVEARAFDWSKMKELERTEMLMSKLWETDHPASLELIDLDSPYL